MRVGCYVKRDAILQVMKTKQKHEILILVFTHFQTLSKISIKNDSSKHDFRIRF